MSSAAVIIMGIEYFNKKIIDAQEKLFDTEILVTGCVYDLLKSLGNSSAAIYAEVAYLEKSGGYRSFFVDSVFIEEESGVITAADKDGALAVWDKLDLSAKEIIMNELFLKYSSDLLYKELSAKDEIH